MIDYYMDYGNIYIINFDNDINGLDIINYLESNFKGKSLIVNGKKQLYLILYQTFNRQAYECYYSLKGKSIHKLETLTGGILLSVMEDSII